MTVSPGGRYYIDTWSDIQLPTRVALFQGNNGALVRRLDTNPVYAAEAWELGQYALVQIQTADGCMLDGNLLCPPDFDPKQRYPVWVQVYGGPHAPRIRNAFISRERDQLLANWGLIVFCVDPRSASSKGAISTWTAYRRLGVVECADLVTALEWLTTHPWVEVSALACRGTATGAS